MYDAVLKMVASMEYVRKVEEFLVGDGGSFCFHLLCEAGVR